MNDDHNNDPLLDRNAAAARLGISRRKLGALIRASKGPPRVTIKDAVFYRQSILDAWRHALDQRRVPPGFPEYTVREDFVGLDALYTAADVAGTLGVSPGTLVRWREKGLAPHPEHTIKGWRYRGRAVSEYLAYRAWLGTHWWTP